jgi:3-mercaptopyruvate sulfurtransferase SseA
VAQIFEDYGVEEAHALIGGFDAWRAAGLPVEAKREVLRKTKGGEL